MSQEKRARPIVVLSLLLAFVLVATGVAVRKLRAPSGGAPTAAQEAEGERARVAAFDPAFDPKQAAGSITGVVRDADGRPVDGAVVAATRNRGKSEAPSFTRATPARTAVTAGGGRFRLDEVLPGEYALSAASPEFAPARQNKVEVRSGASTDVTLTMGKGGQLLTGEVQDIGGGAVGGATALLRGIGAMIRPGEPSPLLQAAADDKGVFKIRVLPGQYELTVKAEGYAPARDYFNFSGAASRRYKLNPAARLTGRVLDRKSNEPVAGASVWLRLDRVESYVDRDATSDADGRFAFNDLTAGGYVVLARSGAAVGLARPVSVGVAQAVDGVDVFIERGRAIRGTVVDGAGKPLAGIRVMAGRADPPYERPVSVNSDATGSFALEGLLPARYRVSGWGEGGRSTASPEMVQVTSKDLPPLKLVVTTGLALRGQVVDGSGKPVAEAVVFGSVERKSGEQRFAFDRAVTDGEGKFALERLAEGRLTVVAKHPERGTVTHGPEDLGPTAPTLKLTLASSAAVSGTVTFEDGTPAPRVIVFAPPSQMYGRPMLGPPEQASTDEAGRYQLTGMDKGTYVVMARTENAFGGGNPRTRQEVTLAVGEQKSGVDLVLPTAGKRISGSVVGADGRPVSGAVVTAGPEREGSSFRMPQREGFPTSPHAVTDHEGAFTIGDLPEGKFTLWANDSAHADGERKGIAAGETGVVVKLDSGASVAGVVHSRDGKPVADYNVAALPGGPPGQSPDDRMRLQATARLWSPTVQIHDPGGAFFIGRLAPGAYELTVTTADGQGGLLPVTVTVGEKKAGLTILINESVKLTGRVVELDTGAPLEGVQVMVASATNRLNASTGKDGAFSLSGLSPGRSRVDFRIGDGETYVPEHIEIEVKPGQGTVDAGTIKKMKGSNRQKRGDYTTNGRVGVTVSLLDGKASVTGVRPGFPADRAGLKQGELVLSINGRATDGLGNGALDHLAGGKLGEPLTLKIQPRGGGAAREVTLTRVPIDYDPARPAVAGTQPGR